MSDGLNFELEDLVTRYTLHPEFCDVFVEGETDQGFIQAFLSNNGRSQVSVYPISSVNIAPEQVLRYGLSHPNNRNELVALAYQLFERIGNTPAVTFIADADSGHVLPVGNGCELLLLTDFASMEMYAFDEHTMERLLLTVDPGLTKTAGELIDELSGPLQELFLLRITNLVMGLGLSWIKLEKLCSISRGRFQFNLSEYKRRYLQIRVPKAKSEDFRRESLKIRSGFKPDVRCQIRGGDFVELLTWFLTQRKRCKHLNCSSVRQLLYLAVSPDTLAQFALFEVLLARTERCSGQVAEAFA